MDQSPSGSPAPVVQRRPWLIPVIIASVIVTLILVVLAMFFVARTVLSSLSEPISIDRQPLVEGAPGSPVAVTPLDCATPCFSEASIEAMLPTEAAFAEFGVPEATYPVGTYDPATVSQLHRAAIAGWTSNGGTPDECVFAPADSPHLASIDAPEASSTDVVYFLGTHEDVERYNTVDQAARIFADSVTAEAFMRDLATNIDACDEITIGIGGDSHTAQVDPAAALAVPDSVAAVGWVRTGQPGVRWRAYVFDVQRGNVVIRTRLLTDGSITEEQFRSFAEGYAARIAELQLN